MKVVFALTGMSGFASATRLADKLEFLVKNRTSGNQMALPRRLGLDFKTWGKYFVRYGCWCNFDSAGELTESGKGKPVDQYDEQCKRLRDNYQCIMLDEEAVIDGEMCKPWLQEYASIAVQDADGIAQACEVVAGKHGEVAETTGIDAFYGNYNGNSRQTEYNKCVELACVVESHFVNKASEIIQPSDLSLVKTGHNPVFEHDNGFDTKSQCVVEQGTHDSERECCGSYPDSVPYKPSIRMCCPDNVVRMQGTC